MNCNPLILMTFCLSMGVTARTICMSTQGNDVSGDGSSSSPYATLGKAISQCLPGDTVFIRNGVYNDGEATIGRELSGTAQKPTVIMGESRDDAVFDAQWTKGNWLKICNANYIYVKNLTLRRYVPYAVNRGILQITYDCSDVRTVSEGCVFENIFIDSSGVCGISFAVVRNLTLRQIEARHCMEVGILGCGDNDGIQITGCRMYRNNPGYLEIPWVKYRHDTTNDHISMIHLDPNDNLYHFISEFGCGGIKLLNAINVEIDDFDGSENFGPGLWFDTGCKNVNVRNSSFIGNRKMFHKHYNTWLGGSGFMFEANYPDLNAVVENCEARDNESESCVLAEDQGLTIRNCTLHDKIFLREGPQREPDRDFLIENNRLVNCWLEGWCSWTAETLAVRNIVFQGNTWQGEEPRIQLNNWYISPVYFFEAHGLDEMRAAWNTFLTDTYSTEITALRPVTRSIIGSGNEIGDMTPVFDLRGRFIAHLPIGVKAVRHRGLAQPLAARGKYVRRYDGVVLMMNR